MTDPDNYRCACGNTPDSDGFYTCDAEGNDLEPVLGGTWQGLYRCDRCGVVALLIDEQGK